jgi:hypothetical protein
MELAQYGRLSGQRKRHPNQAMPCPEHLRLRQLYEAALRYWGRVILSSDANLVGALARQAAQIKQTAFADRNAAKKRLDDHSLTCPTCNPKLRMTSRNVH